MRNAKIALSIMVWAGAFLLALHQSEHQEVLGRYSWSYACFLGFIVGVAAGISLAKPNWLAKLKEARAGIVVIAMSFLLAIGAAELVLRTVDPLGISYYELAGEYLLDKNMKRAFRGENRDWSGFFGDFSDSVSAQASTVAAWTRRNSPQLGPVLRGVGSR